MRRLLSLLVMALLPSTALAQDGDAWATGLAWEPILATFLYGLIGIALCVAGYFAFDKIAGLSLKHELVEDQNLAVGVMLSGVFIGLAIVVAAVMLS